MKFSSSGALRPDKAIVKDVEAYLNLEIIKRWPLVKMSFGQGRMGRVFWPRFENGMVGSFYLYPFRFRDGVHHLRITDGIFPLNPKPGVGFFRQGASGMELTFDLDEIETVVPWTLDNYLAAKQVPEWLNDQDKLKIEIGSPLIGMYLTSKKGGYLHPTAPS